MKFKRLSRIFSSVILYSLICNTLSSAINASNKQNELNNKELIFNPSGEQNQANIELKPFKVENNLNNDEYIIDSGDLLELIILDAPELSGELRVLSDGNVQIPIVGNFVIRGLTINQATDAIKDLLNDHLLRTDLSIKILRTRPIFISLAGEIKRPGIYSFNKFNSSENGIPTGIPTVIDAIQKAGGVTQNTDIKNIRLFRKLPGNNNEYKVTNLDLYSLVIDGNQIYNPYLFDGDKIVFNIAKENLNISKSQEIAVGNLSPNTIKVNVIGEVQETGTLTLENGSTLNQAVLLAGGPINWRANKGKVQLIRLRRNGSVLKKDFYLDLSNPLSAKNPKVQDGDTIFVRTNKFASFSDGVGALSRPASGIVTVWSLLKIIGD